MLSGRNDVSVVLSDNCQTCKAGASLLFSFFCLCLFWGEGTVCTWGLKEDELSSPSLLASAKSVPPGESAIYLPPEDESTVSWQEAANLRGLAVKMLTSESVEFAG